MPPIAEYRAPVSIWKIVSLVIVIGAAGILGGKTLLRTAKQPKPPVANTAAFLKLPFATDVQAQVVEGWLYSKEEQQIHGRKIHHGIDFSAPRGTPVYAAADGLAIASFDTEEDGKWQDKRIGFGYGRFVQVWNPTSQLFIIYSHLETVSPDIYYEEPTHTELGWKPLLPKSGQEMAEHQNTTIKKGELIGYVGDSGLTWGYTETPTNRPDPRQFPSWDETHLHFEVFRYKTSGEKESFDPYGLYAAFTQYAVSRSSENSLWESGESGQILYSR